jgi:LmbE family N-acetylglucosaminyl deacetylase
MLRQWLRRKYLHAIYNRAQICNTDSPEFGRSTLVFAPHQDDETLGCGGTIIKKKARGTDVKIVFMGDGSSSHSHLIAPQQLSEIRTREAVAAGRVLGVGQSDILFLGFSEGRLHESFEAAIARVGDLVVQHQPAEVFIPYIHDPNADHVATNQVVRRALAASRSRATVYEYPVWSWWHWPWVGLLSGIRRPSRRVLKGTLHTALGLRMARDFRFAVYTGDVLARKRAALAEHGSQMTRLQPNPAWLTLHDVSNGEWLDCFFQEYELFQRDGP